MRTGSFRIGVIFAAAFVASIGAQISVPTTPPPQTRAGGSITAKPPTGPTPRKPNGQPDLAGVWLRRTGISTSSSCCQREKRCPTVLRR